MEDATGNLSNEELDDLALEIAWELERPRISPDLDEFDARMGQWGEQ